LPENTKRLRISGIGDSEFPEPTKFHIFIEKEYSVQRRLLMNFPGSFKSKSLRISQPIFDFTKKEFEKSGCWTQGGPNG